MKKGGFTDPPFVFARLFRRRILSLDGDVGHMNGNHALKGVERHFQLATYFASRERDGVVQLGGFVDCRPEELLHPKGRATAMDVAGQAKQFFCLYHCNGLFAACLSSLLKVKLAGNWNHEYIDVVILSARNEGLEAAVGVLPKQFCNLKPRIGGGVLGVADYVIDFRCIESAYCVCLLFGFFRHDEPLLLSIRIKYDLIIVFSGWNVTSILSRNSELLVPDELIDGALAVQNDANGGGEAASSFDNSPIGVFDSGFGGLTVAHEIAKALPGESIIYLGDSDRCPYGPRSLAEVDSFVQQIGSWLVDKGVKLIVIACNTATAAGLVHAQQTFDVPVIGVVNPGARAAAMATRNRRVGVIATQATVESGAYSRAIRNLDEGITVFSTATPRFVEIAEQGIRMAEGPIEDYMSLASKVYIRPAFQEIAREYLEPLRRCNVDTLVMGCTHFPLLKALIGGVIGRDVTLISSAEETARDVAEILARRGARASSDHVAEYSFFTTGHDVAEFKSFGSRAFRMPIDSVEHVELP